MTITRDLADRADRLTEISGLPDPYFAAPKMTWLRHEHGQKGGKLSGTT